MGHGNVTVVENRKQWDAKHKEAAGKPVIVDFTASWCGPCRIIAPTFDQLSLDFPQLIFLKVDVDANEDIARECEISAMPTFCVFKDGQLVDQLVGASKAALETMVAKHATP